MSIEWVGERTFCFGFFDHRFGQPANDHGVMFTDRGILFFSRASLDFEVDAFHSLRCKKR